MESRDFDRLARLAGAGQSRRGVLKALAGGALDAVAAVLGLDQVSAAARCRSQGVVCSKNADCCSSNCLPKDRTGRRYCAECGSDADCPGSTCRDGFCCVPDAIEITCAGGVCGVATNNCGLDVQCLKLTLDACQSGDECCSGSCVNNLCCKGSGVACTDDPECCGKGFCVQGVCCTDDPYEVTCAGVCGQQVNNCGVPIDCGVCA